MARALAKALAGPAESTREATLDAIGALGARLEARLDAMDRRLDAMKAQLEAVRRAHAVYLGDHVACTYLHNGWRIFVDTRSFDVGIHLIFGGRWEPQHSAVFERMLFRGAGVLDIGANHGYYSLIAAPIVGPEGMVVAIEPNPRHARLLHYSLSINGFLNRAEVHNLAVADASGVAALHVDAHMTGGATLRPAGARITNHSAGQDTLMVEVATIDALLGERRGRINVVKMDVEGAEPAVLRGMAQLLVEARPLRMLLEFNGHAPGVTAGFRDVLPMLEREGFQPYRVICEAEVQPLGWERLLQGGRREDVVIARQDDRGWIHGL